LFPPCFGLESEGCWLFVFLGYVADAQIKDILFFGGGGVDIYVCVCVCVCVCIFMFATTRVPFPHPLFWFPRPTRLQI
jgi:hypothetical protein